MNAGLAAIWTYVQSYYEAVFRKGYFAGIIVMLGCIIFINYSYPAPAKNGWLISFLSYYFLYLLPFAFAYLLQWFYFDDRSFFRSTWFWILLLTAPAIFAFRINFSFHKEAISVYLSEKNIQQWLAAVNYLVRIFVLIVPAILLWYLKDGKQERSYGFAATQNNSVYFLLLAVMLPLIALAAAQPDFLQVYPKAFYEARVDSVNGWIRLLFFELSYALDFVSIEFFFRGFLVIAFIRICGMRAIVPAACFYCCIHLGKPMAEAISSFFGGLLLGIISYHTRSIWGGLIIHIGIAWAMEAMAFLYHPFN